MIPSRDSNYGLGIFPCNDKESIHATIGFSDELQNIDTFVQVSAEVIAERFQLKGPVGGLDLPESEQKRMPFFNPPPGYEPVDSPQSTRNRSIDDMVVPKVKSFKVVKLMLLGDTHKVLIATDCENFEGVAPVVYSSCISDAH